MSEITKDQILDNISAIVDKLGQLQSDLISGNLYWARSAMSGITSKVMRLDTDITIFLRDEGESMFNLSDTTGPTTVHHEYETCRGCKYLEHKMVLSGRNPVYHYWCKYPIELKHGFTFETFLGTSPDIPAYCPARRKGNNHDTPK